MILDTSDDISADHIISALTDIKGAVVVIDYLQLLDQNRSHPPLADQIAALQQFATLSDSIFILLSQIDPNFDPSVRAMPGLQDIRRPNPLDLSIFDTICTLHDARLSLSDTPPP